MKKKVWKKFFRRAGAFVAAVIILFTSLGTGAFAGESENVVLYPISFGELVNGTATINGETSTALAAGEKVTVKAVPDKGYEVTSLVVAGRDGKELISRNSLTERKISFSMPEQECIIYLEFSKEKTAPEKVTAGDSTTTYLTENLKKGKAKEAEAISQEYWEEEAPANAAEAGKMYLADAEDKKYSSRMAGASNVEDSAELNELKATPAEKHFDENGLRQTSHNVTVTYTIANDRYLRVNTIDKLFHENIEAFLTAVASTSPVYESRDVEDAYIAFLNYGKMNGLSNNIIDAEFVTGEQHNPVDAEKDVVFDKTKGIVYIPKSYYFSTDGAEIGYDLQAQVLVCPKGEKNTTSIRVSVENKSKAQATMDKKDMEVSAFDTVTIPLTTPETAKKISFKDIHVYLNDSAIEAPLTEGDLAGFDRETGEYTINQLAANIYSVRFVINGKSLAERISRFFKGMEAQAAPLDDGETAGAKMNAVKNVTTGKYITPSIEYDKLKAKETYAFDGKNRTHKFELIKDMMDAGVKNFVYAPYLPDSGTDSIRDAFYFAIADDEGSGSKSLAGLIDKLKDKGSDGLVNAGGQNPDAGASSTINTNHSRFYWYMFLIGAPSGTLKEVDSGKEVYFGKSSEWKWSNDYSYEGETTYQNMYPAMCCHIGDDILDSKKKNQVSVLEKKDGYVVLGLVQSDEGTSQDSQAGATIIKVYVGGKIRLKKVSESSEMTKGNPCYSLAGAKYGVYASKADAQEDKSRIATLTTKANMSGSNEDGCYTEETGYLSAGTYYVKELEASPGYRLDRQIHSVTVESTGTTEFNVSESPLNDPSAIRLIKIDKDTGAAVEQGAASLAGAQFTVKYYAGYYTKDNLPNIPTRTWVFETKEVKNSSNQINYLCLFNANYKVGGDDFYYIEGVPVFPLGTISIEETKEPEGYLLEGAYFQEIETSKKVEGIYVSQIHKRGDAAGLVGGNVCTISDKAIYGGVRIQKRDLQSGDAHPQGGASLQAVFEIINTNEKVVVVDGNTCEPGGVAKTLTTNEKGIAETAPDCLPYGKYKISEVSAPEGYLKEGVTEQEFEIIEDGVIVDLTDKEHSITDRVKRGDLEFVKIENGTHKRLAGIPFTITSKTTKESHTIVTDENGYANTASDWNPHTQNTNRGEAAGDGVWFGLNAEGNNVEVDNMLGALPYDIYTIEEQPCKANEGKKLLEPFEVNIIRDSHKINLGTLTNDDKSKVLISKVDATTGKQVEGATLELFKKEGEKWEKVAETVTTADEEWKFTAEPGEYKLVETMAPAGYLMAEAVTFTVADGEAVRRVEMKDEPIEISGNVDKKQTLTDGKEKYFYTIDYCSTSNTWADELNLTDPLESVNEGYTRLKSIQTPVSFDDYDGKMNVWYQTNKTDPKDVSDANAYNACGTNPDNPANPDNERMTDYTGWKLWKEGVSTLEAESLKVSDLKLGEDEYVTAFRFEHGRVAEGFTTRKSKKSKLDAEKSEHDNLKEVAVPHKSVFNLKDAENPELKKEQEIHYSPAVLEMEVISEDYRAGKAELVNSVQLNIFRNKGVTDKLMDEDEDRVVQEYPPKEEPDEPKEPKEPDEPEEPGKPSAPSSPSRTPGIITTVQTGLAHYGGWFALAAAVLAGAAVVVWRRKNRTNHAEEKEEP